MNRIAKRRRTEKPPRLLDGKFYVIIKQVGQKVDANCSACGKTRRGNIDSTGNFMKHIKQDHPELVDAANSYRKHVDEDDVDMPRKKQKTLPAMFKRFTVEEVSGNHSLIQVIRLDLLQNHYHLH